MRGSGSTRSIQKEVENECESGECVKGPSVTGWNERRRKRRRDEVEKHREGRL